MGIWIAGNRLWGARQEGQEARATTRETEVGLEGRIGWAPLTVVLEHGRVHRRPLGGLGSIQIYESPLRKPGLEDLG